MRPPESTATPPTSALHGSALLAVAAGGGVGALARYGITEAVPPGPSGTPWGILTINTIGCLLIGILMPLASELWAHRRLLRPFLGAGVLGGFTTFSTYALDTQQAIAAGTPGPAVLYTCGTMLSALAAVFVGTSASRWLVRRS